jgi:predicted PurR-regulated permease PerM
MLQLANAFGDVFSAQLRISLINARSPGIYCWSSCRRSAYRCRSGPTLVGFTFFASLVPIIGNLLSNAAITIAALTSRCGSASRRSASWSSSTSWSTS